MFYVYVLENGNNRSFYIGFTSNLKQRISDHLNGKGGRTTRLKSGWRLIYFEGYLSKRDALGREKFLKGGSGRKYLYKQLNHYLFSKEKSQSKE
ncbi:MAG: GIY-YIG nuclease family protein [Patescibacteria group bacterium]